MNFKEYKSLRDAYNIILEQRMGVPTDNPDETLQKIIDSNPKYGGGKVVPLKPTKSANIQKAHYEPEGEVVIEDVYDEVFNFLLNEGCTVEESNYIMTYVVEQGMHPQEVVARGIANILGLDKPHPTQVFAQGLRKMLYPNKPVEVKAPKPPTPKVTKVSSPAAKPTTTKPNPYRPGATLRATGPNLDKFPELARFADQGRKIAEPVAKTASTIATLRNLTPAGAAAAVMAPRPTADGTLTAAMKRGDVALPAPKLPTPQKAKKPTQNTVTKDTVKKVKPNPVIKDTSKTVATKTKSVDPDIKRYQELRTKDPAKAKELGNKIWLKKYGSPTEGDYA
jgi:hypothetical protein